jgi:metal-responsive CopG/Arc/MetJ family transcriptional regulator
MAKSIKLNNDLWKRIEQHSAAAGYSSPEEFIEHLIEEELIRRESPEAQEAANEAERRLKGLGYLE